MYSFGGFLTKMGVKIFHYKPSSYWGTPIFENPYWKKTQIPNGHPGPLNPLPKSLKRFWRASTSATIPWVAPGEEMPWHMRQEPISTYFNIFPPFSILSPSDLGRGPFCRRSRLLDQTANSTHQLCGAARLSVHHLNGSQRRFLGTASHSGSVRSSWGNGVLS